MKELIKLQKKSYRDEVGLFLIEGERETERALQQGVPVEKIFLMKPHPTIESLAIEKRIPTVYFTEKTFQKVSYRENPDGVLAVAKKFPSKDLKEALQKLTKGFFLICVGIEKPGNLGAMLRSADAAGAEGIILCDPHVDLFNPNVVRASMGTLFSVPIYSLSSEEAVSILHEHGVQMVATTPHAKEIYTDIVYAPKVAIAMGKEQTGLPPYWENHADVLAQIPMKGLADSLNVASAATLFLYEVMRQQHVIRR